MLDTLGSKHAIDADLLPYVESGYGVPGADQMIAAVRRATMFLPRFWKPSSRIISRSSSSSVRRASSDLIHRASSISSASEYASISWPGMIQGRGLVRCPAAGAVWEMAVRSALGRWPGGALSLVPRADPDGWSWS